tara:strand:- start:405 stop:620 length:216 start_codon:yes stop_codon:yes gene_type:complete
MQILEPLEMFGLLLFLGLLFFLHFLYKNFFRKKFREYGGPVLVPAPAHQEPGGQNKALGRSIGSTTLCSPL